MTAVRCFSAFCGPFPVDELLLCRFVAAIAKEGLKLCPAYACESFPKDIKATHTRDTNVVFVRGVPSLKRKNAPTVGPRQGTYRSISITGQTSVPMRPTNTSTPLPN